MLSGYRLPDLVDPRGSAAPAQPRGVVTDSDAESTSALSPPPSPARQREPTSGSCPSLKMLCEHAIAQSVDTHNCLQVLRRADELYVRVRRKQNASLLTQLPFLPP